MKKNMLILVGPSGAGKSTLLARALKDYANLKVTTSFTTRSMRNGEKDGDPYYFVTAPHFEDLISKDFFVEWAKVHTNYYGTPLYQLSDAWALNQTIIMDVDVQGAKTFQQKFRQALTVFILPPSIEVLSERIAARDKVLPPDFQVRMQNAIREIDQAKDFDRQIINGKLEVAYQELKKIIEEMAENR